MIDFLYLFAQQTINGVYLGLMYAMVALGLTLIYGVMNQINFAHSDFVTCGAFAAYFVSTRLATKWLGIPDTLGYVLSVFASLFVGTLLGLLINAIVFVPLRKNGGQLRPLIATIGISVLIENGLLAWVGPVPYQFDSPFTQVTYRLGKIFLSQQNILVILITVGSVAAIYAFLKYTFFLDTS